MAFGRRNNAHAAPTTDYGSPAVRSNRLHRPLLAANHALHLASSLIVLGISAYFINDFTHNTHLRYWVAIVRPRPSPLPPRCPPRLSPNPSVLARYCIMSLTTWTKAAVDSFFYIPALVLPALKRYKGYLAPLAWIMSYLWLTAFIFSVQDYEYNGGCAVNSPRLVNKCSLKRTIEAFTFLAL